MLKTFTKFVLQRRGRTQRVVKDDYTIDPASGSESPTQPAELDEPSSPPVSGKVKWYNPAKRYGFVELTDGSGDAFLHATTLSSIDINSLQPGETLELRSFTASLDAADAGRGWRTVRCHLFVIG